MKLHRVTETLDVNEFALNNTHTIEFALERCGFARHGLQGFV